MPDSRRGPDGDGGQQMQDVALGIVAAGVGALLCFRGYLALRWVIAVWGAFVGFFLGAGVVASLTGDGLLATALGWTVGLTVAVVAGLLAYFYYAVSVVLGMGAIGFALGTSLAAALGITWNWVLVLVGVAAGLALAVLAIVGDLPMIILALLGAFAGASAMITGALLVLGVVDTADLANAETTQTLELGWWWTAAYLFLVIAGLASQAFSAQVRRATLREGWQGEPAR
ncbi:MAG TPA: DUF4203 domain-containing protein [Actinotalea sp.]|nr:DUF4203 domain-containing protein [Actinotalea sp.]